MDPPNLNTLKHFISEVVPPETMISSLGAVREGKRDLKEFDVGKMSPSF